MKATQVEVQDLPARFAELLALAVAVQQRRQTSQAHDRVRVVRSLIVRQAADSEASGKKGTRQREFAVPETAPQGFSQAATGVWQVLPVVNAKPSGR
jgi:hypothetical protein